MCNVDKLINVQKNLQRRFFALDDTEFVNNTHTKKNFNIFMLNKCIQKFNIKLLERYY